MHYKGEGILVCDKLAESNAKNIQALGGSADEAGRKFSLTIGR